MRLAQLTQLRPRLLQPEPHVHLAVHRRRGGEMLVRLLVLALCAGRACRGRDGSGRGAVACRALRPELMPVGNATFTFSLRLRRKDATVSR